MDLVLLIIAAVLSAISLFSLTGDNFFRAKNSSSVTINAFGETSRTHSSDANAVGLYGWSKALLIIAVLLAITLMIIAIVMRNKNESWSGILRILSAGVLMCAVIAIVAYTLLSASSSSKSWEGSTVIQTKMYSINTSGKGKLYTIGNTIAAALAFVSWFVFSKTDTPVSYKSSSVRSHYSSSNSSYSKTSYQPVTPPKTATRLQTGITLAEFKLNNRLVPPGTMVKIINSGQYSYKIRLQDGTEGYVSRSYIKLED